MEVWLLLGDCSDYYCEGLHPIAVATSEESAEQLRADAKKAMNWYGHGENRRGYRAWAEVSVQKIRTDTLTDGW